MADFDFNRSIHAIQKLLDVLPAELNVKSRQFVLVKDTLLKKLTTLIRDGFRENVVENELKFHEVTSVLRMYSNYVTRHANSLLTNTVFKSAYADLQDAYVALYERLPTENAQFALEDGGLVRRIRQSRAPKVDVKQPPVAHPQPIGPHQPDAVLVPVVGAYDVLPGMLAEEIDPIPAFGDPLQTATALSRLKLWMSDTVFVRTADQISHFNDGGDNRPLLQKIWDAVYRTYKLAISIVEDLVRGVFKLAFFCFEKLFGLLDGLLEGIVTDLGVLDVIQKTIHAVGEGFDDALGQQFGVIKEPYDACKKLLEMGWGLLKLLGNLAGSVASERCREEVKAILDQASNQLKALGGSWKEDPYLAVRQISCGLTHATIMALLIIYGPTGGSSASPAEAQCSTSLSSVGIPQGPASVSVGATVKTVVVTRGPHMAFIPPAPLYGGGSAMSGGCAGAASTSGLFAIPSAAATVTPTEQRRATLADHAELFDLICLLDITNQDDVVAYTQLSDEMIALEKREGLNRFAVFVDSNIADVTCNLELLDKNDKDDASAIAHFEAELMQYNTLKEKISPAHCAVDRGGAVFAL